VIYLFANSTAQIDLICICSPIHCYSVEIFFVIFYSVTALWFVTFFRLALFRPLWHIFLQLCVSFPLLSGLFFQPYMLVILLLQSLKNPAESFAKYQGDIITQHADVVTRVTQEGVDKLQNLQAQHQVSNCPSTVLPPFLLPSILPNPSQCVPLSLNASPSPNGWHTGNV